MILPSNPKRIYLAGPIAGLTAASASGWREIAIYFLERRGLIGISPMRAKVQALSGHGVLTNQGYDDSPMSTQKGIVTRDRNDVMNCDAMLVNLVGVNKLSLGTAVEFGWADAFRKPIITVLDLADTNNPFGHAFIRELSGFIVPTLDEGIDICGKLLLS